MKKWLFKKAFAFLLIFTLLISNMAVMATAGVDKFSDLPVDAIPIVEVEVKDQALINDFYEAGLDVLRVNQVDAENGIDRAIIMVHEHEKEYFIKNNINYIIVEEDATYQEEFLGYVYEKADGITAFGIPLPGFETGTGTNQYPAARTDLVVDPNAVFNPTNVLMDEKYGFPVRLGYRTVTEYYAEMNYLAQAYPELVTLHVVGESIGSAGNWTGNVRANEIWAPIPIIAMEICNKPGENDGRPESMHLAGNHAREWPSNELAMDMVWNLLTEYGKNKQITDLLDTTKVWVMPVTNPDGMHWDQTHSPGTFRRNRRPAAALNQYGVDINRNYAYDWGSNQGSSGTPGGDTYRGAAQFSEPETAAIRDVFMRNQIITSISGHTWGDMILYPWSFSVSSGHQDLIDLGRKLFEISLYADQVSNALYFSNGGKSDWVFGATGGLSYTFEYMRHPSSGFVPPYQGVNEYKVIAPYNDFNGSQRKMPILYSTNATIANNTIPKQDVKGEVVFLNNSDNDFLFGHSHSNRFGTAARVQALGDLTGKILMTNQGSSAANTLSMLLAAQNAGAVGVVLCGNTSETATNHNNNVELLRPSFGTTGDSLNVNIAVGQTNKQHIQEYQRWVKSGGKNEVTMTSYMEPGGNSVYSHYERLIGAFLLTMEAAGTYASYINGQILDADSNPIEGAVLTLSVETKSPQRHPNDNPASANNPQPNPIDFYVETQTSRLDVPSGTYSWAVTPSVQAQSVQFNELKNEGYAVTASANGRYSQIKNVVVEGRKEAVNGVDFVLPSAISVDYDYISVLGNDAVIPFSTYELADSGNDSVKGFTDSMGELAVTVNGLPVEVISLGDGDFIAKFKLEGSNKVELVIDFDGSLPHSAYKDEFELTSNRNPITSLRIDALSIFTVARGGVYNFDFILNEGAGGKYVVWAIADPSLGYVDKAGTITIFDKTGNVRLTATDPFYGTTHSITLRIAS